MVAVKAALIPPIPELTRFGQGDFHLLLSHLLQDKRYFRHYYQQRQKGAYLVLDNSAHEHGSGDDPEALIYNAAAINAQEVVVPDVLDDAEATIEKATESLEIWFESKYDIIHKLLPALMYVPQGKNETQWVICLLELIRMHVYTAARRHYRTDIVIGLSKDYEVWDGGLLNLLENHLLPLKTKLASKQIKMHVHLLGWGRDLWALESIAHRNPWIRSTDSAKPFVYAANKITLDPIKNVPPYPGRPKDYFEIELIGKKARERATINSMIYRACASGNVLNTVRV